MKEVRFRVDDKAGIITLSRPAALNALTHSMCLAIERALDAWSRDDDIALVILEAEGDRAFCAGGDITEMYRTGMAGDLDYGRTYWRDEYRLNAKISGWQAPIVSFMQGYTMGGGVGLGCHASHRIVGDSSRVSMPECKIGLVPDVGGSWLLSSGMNHSGEYLGLTGIQMEAADAIFVGFADYYVSEGDWSAIKLDLSRSGRTSGLLDFSAPTVDPAIKHLLPEIDLHFGKETLSEIVVSLQDSASEFAIRCINAMCGNSPLSMACTLELLRKQRSANDIRAALDNEFRFAYRSAQFGDFIEGIRARVIDKDNQPSWKHAGVDEVKSSEVEFMLSSLGDNSLNWSSCA